MNLGKRQFPSKISKDIFETTHKFRKESPVKEVTDLLDVKHDDTETTERQRRRRHSFMVSRHEMKAWLQEEGVKRGKSVSQREVSPPVFFLPTTLTKRSFLTEWPSSSNTRHSYLPQSLLFCTSVMIRLPLLKTLCRWFWGRRRPSVSKLFSFSRKRLFVQRKGRQTGRKKQLWASYEIAIKSLSRSSKKWESREVAREREVNKSVIPFIQWMPWIGWPEKGQNISRDWPERAVTLFMDRMRGGPKTLTRADFLIDPAEFRAEQE